jgi:DNA-binding CsgD family transcriptional regulator
MLDGIASSAEPPCSPREGLSRREREVFDLIARGMTNREIAALLELSENTVKVYVRRTLTKLDVSNRTEAVGLYGDQRAREGDDSNVSIEVSEPRLVGRDAELGWLLRALGEADLRTASIEGLAGTGKTALALAAAERLRGAFPEGAVRVSLGGTMRTPPTATETMRSILRALEPAAACPHSGPEVESAYRSTLRDRRVLLILDDAAAPSQLDALEPPRGPAVLITSRLRMARPESQTLGIGPLPSVHAQRMLLALAPRAGASAARIAQACGALPLALVMAARALAARPDLTPHALCEDLRDAHVCLRTLDQSDPSQGVEAALRASLEGLPEPVQRAFAQLGAAPHDIDRSTVAAMWGASSADCDLWLGRLLRHHLIDWGGGAGAAARYRMHPLVRIYAGERLAERETEVRQHNTSQPLPLRARAN